MRSEAREWIQQAEYDIDTGEALLHAGRYIYTLFMCHLAIEKTLKAYVVEYTGEVPPKTHDLIVLLQRTDPGLKKEHLEFIASLSAMGVATRYPENFSRALRRYSKNVALDYFSKTKEVLQCLKQGL